MVSVAFLSDLIERETSIESCVDLRRPRLRALATLGDQSHRTAKRSRGPRQTMRVHVVWKNLHNPRYGCLHPSQPFAGDYRHGSIRDQKQIRLQATRARVLADDVDAATVAFEVGHKSATKSIVNKRLFGQPPIREYQSFAFAELAATRIDHHGQPSVSIAV